MDQRKRASWEHVSAGAARLPLRLIWADAEKIVAGLSDEQLRSEMVIPLLYGSRPLLTVADTDVSWRKVFIHGIKLETTAEDVFSVFSHYGEIERARIVKPRGFSFITFKNFDSAHLAVREPCKKIGASLTFSFIDPVPHRSTGDVSLRKIYVSGVPADTTSDSLISLFSTFGEIDYGPLVDYRGEGVVVYKTAEAAAAAINNQPIVEGQSLVLKLRPQPIEGAPLPAVGGGGRGGGRLQAAGENAGSYTGSFIGGSSSTRGGVVSRYGDIGAGTSGAGKQWAAPAAGGLIRHVHGGGNQWAGTLLPSPASTGLMGQQDGFGADMQRPPALGFAGQRGFGANYGGLGHGANDGGLGLGTEGSWAQ